MKEYYRRCRRCKELMPLLTYFLSKEEKVKLSAEDKELCYDCYCKSIVGSKT